MSAKSMWLGMAAAIVLAIGASVILQSTGQTSGEKFSSSNVRVK